VDGLSSQHTTSEAPTPTLEPTSPPEPTAPPAPEPGGGLSERTESRKTGIFHIQGYQIEWCRDPDGTIGDQTEQGVPNGIKYMVTHIHQVNSDETISVHTGSGPARYSYRAIYIKNYPANENLLVTAASLEPGDCVLLIGVQSSEPVEVYGVR
jgi:hypothetical protein